MNPFPRLALLALLGFYGWALVSAWDRQIAIEDRARNGAEREGR